MQLPNLAWRGPRGAGKVSSVRRILTDYAARLKIPFNPQQRHWQLQGGDEGGGGEISTSVEESVSTAKGNEKKGLLYETSMIHREFDVARMSLQDKNYIQDILGAIQGTSNILIGDSGPASHIFVFHHAHLLSEESVILLQETLERYGSVVSIFLTTEQPLPERLRDHFLEIPHPGKDKGFDALKVRHGQLGLSASWVRFFEATWTRWKGIRTWGLEHVVELRQWIYICLQRNLRWCDMVQYWTETVQGAFNKGHIGPEELKKYLSILATAKGGGGWIMLPSYRIPIAWERLLLDLTGVMEEYLPVVPAPAAAQKRVAKKAAAAH